MENGEWRVESGGRMEKEALAWKRRHGRNVLHNFVQDA
jgi:hypothetical protein